MSTEQADAALAPTPNKTSIRPLSAADIEAVVAIDKAVGGRARRGFFEKRLAHLARDPSGFVALAAEHEGRVVGFVFARLYEGEFGGKAPAAALDTIGVAISAHGSGTGRMLIEALATDMRAHGVKEISTQVDWANTALTGFFARMGFTLAPRIVLERAVGLASVPLTSNGRPVALVRGKPDHEAAGLEIDYSGPGKDDFEALEHDQTPVRSMTKEDLAAIRRIDKQVTRPDREAYFARKLTEALEESGVRVSLVSEVDGEVCGFLMARVEFGLFGSIEPEAVIDSIGVDSRHGHKGVGSALASQLMTNLTGLRVDRVRTEVDWNHFGLLSFFDRMGFSPHRRLALRRSVN